MDNRELLELAAEAAGITWTRNYEGGEMQIMQPFTCDWNPLTDDGDALRLAVKLGLDINAYHSSGETSACLFRKGVVGRCTERTDKDPYAATRRAIVRAAYEIGKGL